MLVVDPISVRELVKEKKIVVLFTAMDEMDSKVLACYNDPFQF